MCTSASTSTVSSKLSFNKSSQVKVNFKSRRNKKEGRWVLRKPLVFLQTMLSAGNLGQLAKSQICVDYSRNLNFWHLKSNLTSKGTDWIIKEKKGNCHHRFLSIHFQRSYIRKSCCGRLLCREFVTNVVNRQSNWIVVTLTVLR